MKAAVRRVTLLAVSLAACAPGAERRTAEDSADTSAIATASTPDTSATPSGAAAPTRTGSASTADSVRGVVERAGSDPTSRLVVRGADGVACALQMTTPPSFEGLDVTLWGVRDRTAATLLPDVACTVTVARYAVRAVDGVAATDGVLRAQGDAYALETADGKRRPLRAVPATMRAHVGARIYWAGPLDRAPEAYGVLEPAP